MNFDALFQQVEEFSKETHGSSDFHTDELFVMGQNAESFAPLKFLSKHLPELKNADDLVEHGMTVAAYDLLEPSKFPAWFEHQFSRKYTRRYAKNIKIVYLPDNKSIFDALELVNKGYEVLRYQRILMNGKNLPVQLGEWYAKCIFGLVQSKSTSQRGFDFYLGDKRAEVRVHWSDQPSPKGVKVRKSFLELSEYCIIIYVGQNFMIREICFLDSDFIIRKFAGKGHTVFLKDQDVSPYFFSKSDKHHDKVVNSTSLLKFASPTFAMNIAESFQGQES